MLQLHTPVQYVKGIGPRLAEILAGKGISTVEDLLYYLPFRYEDRINPRQIAELRPGRWPPSSRKSVAAACSAPRGAACRSFR